MSLLKKLREYLPTFEEASVHQQTIAFIQMHPNCFDRSLEIGHITASAWLLDNTGTKALLLHHAKLDCWVQPGGHCDGDTDVLRVAIKEAQEESGISQIEAVSKNIFDLDIHQIPEKGPVKAHLHYDIRFLLQVKSDEIARKNHESRELRWIDEILPTNSRSVVRMFEKWKAKSSLLQK
ncbi:MAG TPA: NUDIX hydrolase [Chlamydiales bacterium]|nr:NUDIX hydrolase [Chlamydiales bacterium]